VEVTSPSGEVRPFESLDKSADAIQKCVNYRVVVEAELARIDEQRAELLEKLDEAVAMETMAKDKLRDMVRTLCGVKIEDE